MLMSLLPLLFGCPSDPTLPDTTLPIGAGDGLFLAGCPFPGRSTARVLGSDEERPWGPDATAAAGDVVLMNTRAAFVIQGPDDPRTYYHYGGTPIDAVAVDGCEQAGPEILGEMGFVIGQLDLVDFNASSLHMLRGDTVQIVNDGSDGLAAVVEVYGSDDRFWLIEYSLIRRVFEDGGRKLMGDLYGLEVTVRYTLAPDDTALQIDVLLDGQPVTDGFFVGAVVFPSDYTETQAYASGELGLGGVDLDIGVPWMGSASPTGSTAIGMPGASMARTEIAGVTALLDVNQSVVPLEVENGEQETRFVLAVGPTDGASAAAGLEAHLAEPVPGYATAWADVSGVVNDPAGNPVAGATVEVSSQDDGGAWRVSTGMVTDAEGRYGGRAMSVGGVWRLQARAEGRDDGEAVDVDVAGAESTLSIGSVGGIAVAAVDGDGAPIAVRLELEDDDGNVIVDYPTPAKPSVAVPPGHYSVWATRGYEYAPATTEVTVPEDGVAALELTLTRVVDTEDWASFDSHVHAGPSPDSPVLPEDRMRTAAGSGLDAMISTDHEAILDLAYAQVAEGLEGAFLYVLGSEVTATVPEHTNAWPFPVIEGGRGDPVAWYELGFPGIYAAERARGAQIIQLNHSRVNGECGILCLLDWDRGAGDPATDDPEALGLPAGTEIWSWDFNSFELLNSLRSPYLLADDPRHSGALYDWFAFHNLGHRVTAVGVTDEHGMDMLGAPRTYVRVPDDTPLGFDAQDLADAVLSGAAQVSAGAFARVTLDGAGPGELASVLDGTGDLSLQVQALSDIDVTRVDVIVNCDPSLSLVATDSSGVVKLDQTVPLELPAGDAYVVVIAIGEGPMPRGLTDYAAAEVPRLVVNPIFVDTDGDGLWTPPGAKACGWAP